MRKNCHLIILACVIAASILMIPTRGVDISAGGSADYLADGLKALLDMPMKFLARPLFPLFVTASYELFGVSVESGYRVIRFFFGLNLLILFLLARNFYGSKTAISAFLLALSSYALHFIGKDINPDAAIAFFVMLFLLVLHASFARKNALLFALSGMLLAVACAIKEIAIPLLFLPIVLALAIKENRSWASARRIFLFFLIFALSSIPAMYYTYVRSGVDLMLGNASAWGVQKFTEYPNILSLFYHQLVLNLHRNLFKYSAYYLYANFFLWPLFATWIYVLVRAIKQCRQPDVIIVAAALLMSPSIVIQGYIGERLGQGMPFFYLSYIVFGESIRAAAAKLALFLRRQWPAFKSVVPLESKLLAVAIFLLVLAELFNPRKPAYALLAGTGGTPLSALSFYRGNFTVEGRFNKNIQEASDWLSRNAPSNANVMVDGHLTEAVPFFTRFNFNVRPFSYLVQFKPGFERDEVSQLLIKGRLLAIVTNVKFRLEYAVRYRGFFLLFEEELLQKVAEFNPAYFVAYKLDTEKGRYTNPFVDYFKANQSLKRVFENESTVIFGSAGNVSALDSGVPFLYKNPEFESDLEWLKSEFPMEYEKVQSMLFQLKIE